MSLKIPKTFELFGQKINIVYDPDLLKEKKSYGVADFDENTIYLQPLDEEINRSSHQLEQTFIHELCHFIFLRCGYSKLAKNEDLIEVVSHAVQQVINTVQYDK